MNEQDVIDLMASSKSNSEWNANCDKVKEACNGYPEFWYGTVIVSGLCDRVSKGWYGTGSKIFLKPMRSPDHENNNDPERI